MLSSLPRHRKRYIANEAVNGTVNEAVMAKDKKKKRLPSQEKYDQSHPTVSARLPMELYSRFADYLKETKQSTADFIKGHLDVEEAQVEARVRELAGRRDNLRITLVRLKRQIDELDGQIKKRNQELARPAKEEKARLQREVDEWYSREKGRFERSRAYNETRLETLRGEVEEKKAEVKKKKEQLWLIQLDLTSIENRKKTLAKQERQMQQAIQMINTCPALFCHQCPGAWFNQLIVDMQNKMASAFIEDKGTGGEATQAELPSQGETAA